MIDKKMAEWPGPLLCGILNVTRIHFLMAVSIRELDVAFAAGEKTDPRS